MFPRICVGVGSDYNTDTFIFMYFDAKINTRVTELQLTDSADDEWAVSTTPTPHQLCYCDI